MPNTSSLSISVTVEEKQELERLMAEHGIRGRSDMFRRMLQSAKAIGGAKMDLDFAALTSREPVMDGTAMAGLARSEMARIAGIPVVTGADYPGMGLAAYELALVVARNHMAEISSGTLPVVGDDALAAGMDPHGRRAWELYTETLPGFFTVLLGLDRPPKPDVRYEPLDSVDGQHAGAVRGEVVSCNQVYPDGNTIKYVKLEVRTPAQTVPVLVPAGTMREDVDVGMVVYAAGVFAVARQKVVLRACKCAGIRTDGYDEIYGLMAEWGLSDAPAARIIRMLQERHGRDAKVYGRVFARYARMDKSVRVWDLVIDGPDGERMHLDPADVRGSPPGPDAVRECMRLWGAVIARARMEGVIMDGGV